MSLDSIENVIHWLMLEREKYQTKKFDYEVEKDRPIEYWIQQFDSYIQRLPIFGLDTPQGVQAALKLAATTLALCEHLAEVNVLPDPGYPSGELHYEYTNPD